jgi:adenylate cyclase
MARLSNAQGLLFAEISTEEVSLQGAPVATLKGWFGAQQVGQIKSLVTNTVNEQKGVVTHTVGDSILSSFADANATLNAALGIQRRVEKAQNPSTGTIVKVRIGLSYGPVRVFAGKVSGDSVTAAGILLERAQANEILADQSMLDAVGSVKDTRFEAAGLIEGITAYRVVSLLAPAPKSNPEASTVTAAPIPIPRPTPSDIDATGKIAPLTGGASAIVISFSGSDRRFGPADGEILIGRGKDVHVIVPEIHVSRKHARIIWEAGRIPYLENLSQNGTCVRFKATGKEHTCMARMVLQGAGEIALCGRFSQVASPGEIVGFSLVPV